MSESISAEFAAVGAAMLANAEEWCRLLFPAGRRIGHEWCVGNVRGDPGQSLKINLRKGVWKDFASKDGGSDLVSLYAARNGISQGAAIEQITGQPLHKRANVIINSTRPRAPASAIVPSMEHTEYGLPSHSWVYADTDGVVLGYVARYDIPGRRKQFVPWTWNDERGKYMSKGFETPRPLYGLHDLAARPEARVLIVEGEKAADAARKLAPDMVAVTWPGGAQSVLSADWGAIAGRSVVLWPDADEPGAVAMEKLAGALAELKCSVSRISTEGLTGGWDAADSGFTPEAFREWMQDRVEDLTATTKAEEQFAPLWFELPDDADIPQREFLGGNRSYPVGVATAIVAVGGAAKSSLTIVELLELATGRPLLHSAGSADRYRVWMLNLEDSQDELRRRFTAACRHYGITGDEIRGWMAINSGMDFSEPFITAETTRDGTVVHAPVFEALERHIRAHNIRVLTIDPFVSSHRVTENDNMAIDAIAKRWAKLAHDCRIVVVLVHHSRKTNGNEVSAEDARGGVALIGAVRLVRVLNRMSKTKPAPGIEPDEAWRYFKSVDGKANLAPPDERGTWYRLESVHLMNGPGGTIGDFMGVVTSWQWPDPFEDVSTRDLNEVISRMGTGRWKLDQRSPEWAGKVVGQVLDIDIEDKEGKSQARKVLETWIKKGALQVIQQKDERRRNKDYVIPGRPLQSFEGADDEG